MRAWVSSTVWAMVTLSASLAWSQQFFFQHLDVFSDTENTDSAMEQALALAADGQGRLLLGGVVDHDRPWVGQLDPHGRPQWLLTDDREAAVTGALAVGDGWLVAGAGRFGSYPMATAILGLDADGGVRWQRVLPGVGGPGAVAPLPEGDFLLAGELVIAGSPAGAWLGRFNAGGELLWQRQALPALSSGWLRLWSTCTAPDGSFLAVGSASDGNQEGGWVSLWDGAGRFIWSVLVPSLGRISACAATGEGFLLAGDSWLGLLDRQGHILRQAVVAVVDYQRSPVWLYRVSATPGGAVLAGSWGGAYNHLVLLWLDGQLRLTASRALLGGRSNDLGGLALTQGDAVAVVGNHSSSLDHEVFVGLMDSQASFNANCWPLGQDPLVVEPAQVRLQPLAVEVTAATSEVADGGFLLRSARQPEPMVDCVDQEAPLPDLQLQGTLESLEGVQGLYLSLLLRVANRGAGAAPGAELSLSFPGSVSVWPAPDSCTPLPCQRCTELRCALGTLPPGEETELGFIVRGPLANLQRGSVHLSCRWPDAEGTNNVLALGSLVRQPRRLLPVRPRLQP